MSVGAVVDPIPSFDGSAVVTVSGAEIKLCTAYLIAVVSHMSQIKHCKVVSASFPC